MKPKKRVKAIQLTRTARGGAYNDVLDAAERLAGDYGSASNALAAMVRRSSLYLRDSLDEQLKHKKRQRP